MYLEKLEAQGFKSFANKNVLVFPGMLNKTRRGITAVVGPNGSGKSNVADAVRWALGEQSMKTLRGKKSEDIIFSGSDKKGKLGMAEVSLHLNNEDKQAPVDYSQIVITRRLYRNGDSEYMLNNSRVRLSDIQMLLAKAKFGQKTYSVIGQGMVEGFLNTSLAERKEFFDEATGVKQFQIKRDDSLNKLRSSYDNLSQAQMLLTEIEPRLKSLTRQVNRLKKRCEIEKELKAEETKYYSFLWHDINGHFKKYNKQFLDLEKTKISQDKKLAQLNRDLDKMEVENGKENEFIGLQNQLIELQNKKEELNLKIAKLEAQMEVQLEASGKFDLSFLIGKRDEIEKELVKYKEEIESLEKSIGYTRDKERELQAEKEKLDKQINQLNIDLSDRTKAEGQTEIKSIEKLKIVLDLLMRAREENELEKMKAALIKIEKEIKDIIKSRDNGQHLEERETELAGIHERLNKLIVAKEELVTKINENNLRITARSERVKLLRERIKALAGELEEVALKLKQNSEEIDAANQGKDKEKLTKDIREIQQKIDAARERIKDFNQDEEAKKSKLFSLQREIQGMQTEINNTNNQLNELKINSTRFETKLEDLEIEIREELGSLKEIRDSRPGEIDVASSKEKTAQLKRQLELIGGIDPEIEKEYNETKERFDFLSGQVDDFIGAVDSLQKIIKELDLTIKERFDKEFKIIAGNFEKYFKILFHGGNARIIKVMDTAEEDAPASPDQDKEGSAEKNVQNNTDTADLKKIKFLQKHNATGLAGIEIQATPPGKKIKTITMLSGGERALTAIALICAIINSNPSPFVVLDEVDAALDEANSERLASILDELSHKTQFIVISHNRATMRKANILYGVTMGDDGVSKLLSIKFDDAKEVINK